MDELERNWKYQTTTFYLISCKDNAIPEKYVGHTTNFYRRKRNHQDGCTMYPHRKLYPFINAHGGWDNWSIKPIETISCFSQFQAIEREQHWTNHYCCSLNYNAPSKDPRLRGYRQTWYAKHKDEQLARMRRQYQLTKEMKLLRSIGI